MARRVSNLTISTLLTRSAPVADSRPAFQHTDTAGAEEKGWAFWSVSDYPHVGVRDQRLTCASTSAACSRT